MDLGLSGKTAIVTGSATGIGRSIVELLVDEGVVVAAVDRNAEALKELTSTLQGVSAVNADLSTLEGCRGAVSDALSSLGGMPNILINNAGIGRILA
jgi:Short-chain dehydrogenases of various substrate specificities